MYLDPAFVGQGVGKALYTVLFDALEGEDVHRAFAGIGLPNDASVALRAVRLPARRPLQRAGTEVRPVLGRGLVRAAGRRLRVAGGHPA